jgi:hypothetical protein
LLVLQVRFRPQALRRALRFLRPVRRVRLRLPELPGLEASVPGWLRRPRWAEARVSQWAEQSPLERRQLRPACQRLARR